MLKLGEIGKPVETCDKERPRDLLFYAKHEVKTDKSLMEDKFWKEI